MSLEKKNLGMTPELREEYELHLERFDEHDMSFGRFLDDAAKEYADKLEKHGIVYPVDASTEERWLVLKGALAQSEHEKELKALLERVQTHVQRINASMEEGGEAYKKALRSEPGLNPDDLEEPLSDALDENPELKPLIEEVRKSLKELRLITC